RYAIGIMRIFAALTRMLVIVSVTTNVGQNRRSKNGEDTMIRRTCRATGIALVAWAAVSLGGALPASADNACTPGKTGKIAFMLKHQKAFRYLNADVPFFVKTAEAAGYQVLVQSADHDAAKQVAQAENVITQGVDAIVIQPVDFNVAAQIAEMALEA